MCIDTKERVKAKGGGSKFFSEKTTSVDHVLTIWRVLTRLSLIQHVRLKRIMILLTKVIGHGLVV